MAINAQVDPAVHTGGEMDKHPPGLYVLFATEMWERFSFYSMLALFTLYLQDTTDGFGWARNDATRLYASEAVAARWSAALSPTASWGTGAP